MFVDGIESKVHLLRGTGLPEDSYALSEVLTEHFAQGKPRNISVVSTGPGAKHTFFGCLNFSAGTTPSASAPATSRPAAAGWAPSSRDKRHQGAGGPLGRRRSGPNTEQRG
ncbi:MAG: hypothetical protein MZV70_56595 [Desulfobacterales bacterium]|nr:hypothetical protein [Desulfobacterales bacterium]